MASGFLKLDLRHGPFLSFCGEHLYCLQVVVFLIALLDASYDVNITNGSIIISAVRVSQKLVVRTLVQSELVSVIRVNLHNSCSKCTVLFLLRESSRNKEVIIL